MSNPMPPSDRADHRFSPRHWSLRVKLLVVLLVPGVLAVILGGFRIADRAGEAAELDRVARFASVQGEVATLVERLQQERYSSAAFVAAGRTGDVAALEAVFGEVDATSAATRPAVERLYPDDAGLGGTHRQAEQAFARLPALRNLVLTSNAPATAVISRYSELIGALVQLDTTLLRGVNTTEVNGLASGLAGLAAARNEASLQLALVTAAAGRAEPPVGALAGLPGSDARLRTGLSDFRAALDAGQRVRYGGLIAGASNSGRDRLVQGLAARSGTAALPAGTAAEAQAIYESFLPEIDAAEAGVRAELTTTSAARRQSAVNLAGINSVLLMLALLVGSVIVGLIARAMITSLRTLRRSALDVAEKRLPEAVQRMRSGSVPDVNVEPVPVTSREEVGEVARAFDAVHTQAVRLAAEQATLQNSVNAMFINLSRRSQSLVDRQLQLIEELESHEQDPDQLSHLFRLDHLATRMRRNSENLLVLAGTDLAKRTSQQVPVVDVLQAAVSEIEQYERIIVEQPPPVAVRGSAASDLQHLLAELLDNATTFSPPDSQVTMTSRAADGMLLVEINDHGVGMASDELAETNDRLRRRSQVTVTASRRMGLFVVGRLAARHGVEVRLVAGLAHAMGLVQGGGRSPGATEATGLTAQVAIPAHLIVATDRGPEHRADPQGNGRPEPAEEPAALVPQQRVDSAESRTAEAPGPATSPAGPPAPIPAPRPNGASRAEPTAAPSPAQPVVEPAAAEASTPDAAPDPREPTRDPAGADSLFSPTPLAAGTPSTYGTPIFEEVASGWFRSAGSVPVSWRNGPEHDTAVAGSRPPRPAPAARAAAPSRPPGPAADAADPDSAEFATAADDDWRAAAMAGHGAETERVAGSGLPKRTPGARLLAGSVAGERADGPPRDADAVRARLANYQRGVRAGRRERDGDSG